MSDMTAYPIDRLPAVGAAALCMGVFDGVHRGHLALARATIAAAAERSASSVALVFHPHPDEVVRPGTVVPRLAPLADNLRRLQLAGIDRAIPVRFDADLRALTPKDFLAAMAPSIELRALVMTPESAFGRGRAGTPEAMRVHGRAIGFGVVLVEPLVDEHGPISSARVRAALAAGDIDTATALLGHPPILEVERAAVEPQGPLQFAYVPALPAPGRYRVSLRSAGGERDEGLEAAVDIGADGDVRLDSRPGLPVGQITLELGSRL
jgi:riboflavin kinase / FMN adenylyltransferase